MRKKSLAAPSRRTITIFVTAAVATVALVLLARWLRTLPAVADFIATYPGQAPLPDNAPVGLPAWLGWQHFFNAFFLLLLIKTGWQVRNQSRPPAHWRSKRNRSGPRLSITLWAHLSMNLFWVLNGLIFVSLLFVTGQWMRIVPTTWQVFPNAVSTALQYASLDWPVDNGWVNYNSLQLLTYFVTVFIAAPLAIISGYRMSAAWPGSPGLNKRFPISAARAIHYPVMVYYVIFIVIHVALVFLTGALRNLNHMYAARDDGSWMGFIIFLISVAVMVGGWFASQGIVLRSIASLTGKVSR